MKATIALKYLEKPLPQSLLEKMVAANGKSFGYSFVDDDGLNPTGDHGAPDAEGLFKTQDMMKMATIYIFGQEELALAEDIQPWEMLRDNDNGIACVGFFEGDFTGLVKADSAHTAAFHAKEAVSKKLKMLLRACKGDVEAFYEECKSDEFKGEIDELFTSDGTIVLQFPNDKLLWFANPPERKIVKDIGIFSNLCGWEEPKAVEDLRGVTEVTHDKAKGKGNDKLAALMAKGGTKSADPAAPPPPKPVVVPDKVLDKLPPGSPTTYEGIVATKVLRTLGEEKIWGILKAGGKFKTIENWYRDVGGGWPAGHDKSTMMDLWNSVKAGEQDGTWREHAKKLPGILSTKDKNDARKEYEALVAKGQATDKVTDVVAEFKEDEESEMLPTVSERSMGDLQNFVLKYFDKSHRPINRNPEKLKDFEDKYPSFLEKAGLKHWSDCKAIPPEGWQMIAKRHDLTRLALMSAVAEIIRLNKQSGVVSDKVTASNLPGAKKVA